MVKTVLHGIVFLIALPFIYFIALLPFPLLYVFSDILVFLLFHAFGYRKKIVLENLKNSFPEKSEKEILLLQKKFYYHLCDYVLESIKILTISKETLLQHCQITDETLRLIRNYYDQKKSIILVLGHLGNTEWASHIFSIHFKHQLYTIYHPMPNKFFDQFLITMRTRFGTQPVQMKDIYRHMIKNKDKVIATAFASDQNPSRLNPYWTTFLNQETAVMWGAEHIAKRLNLPVLFVSIKKIKRSYYLVSAETICENSAQTTEGEISELHTRILERDIRNSPEIWLWSHRRWKLKRNS